MLRWGDMIRLLLCKVNVVDNGEDSELKEEEEAEKDQYHE